MEKNEIKVVQDNYLDTDNNSLLLLKSLLEIWSLRVLVESIELKESSIDELKIDGKQTLK